MRLVRAGQASRDVTGAIEELSHVEPKCRQLMSLPEIASIIATGIVAAIGVGEAFERGAILLLARARGSTIQHGRSDGARPHLRAGGSKYLRTLLVQAAKVPLMRPHNWSR
jgi:transposase